uniref:Uncharacterized protein n=1 Tax=Pithovirus LCDPAC02 TaxID=2506601 RepID=A0A481YNJ0_9VIRU|nr:MAG: hypothetical protein LCDPAC02_00470 [Pithovirus LCDPAC02]
MEIYKLYYQNFCASEGCCTSQAMEYDTFEEYYLNWDKAIDGLLRFLYEYGYCYENISEDSESYDDNIVKLKNYDFNKMKINIEYGKKCVKNMIKEIKNRDCFDHITKLEITKIIIL